VLGHAEIEGNEVADRMAKAPAAGECHGDTLGYMECVNNALKMRECRISVIKCATPQLMT